MRGLDPMYFDRRRSIESALNWGGWTVNLETQLMLEPMSVRLWRIL